MSSCTSIEVFGLSVETMNRLRLTGTSAKLSLSPKFSLRLSKSAEGLSVVGKITTAGVLGFSVDINPVNDAIFLAYSSGLVLDRDVYFYEVRVIVNGHPLEFTRLYYKDRNLQSQTYELELRRDASHWIDQGQTMKVNEIDFGLFAPGSAPIEGYWDRPVYTGDYRDPFVDGTKRPYYDPIIDYGGWVDQSEPLQEASEQRVKAVGPEDIRPLLSLPYMIQRGAFQFGWTVEGVIFDTEWVNRLWVYILNQNYYEADQKGGRIKGRLFETLEMTAVHKPIRFTELVKGESSEVLHNSTGLAYDAWDAGIKNRSKLALKYKMILKGKFWNDRPNQFTCVFQVVEVDPGNNDVYTGESISPPEDFVEVVFSANEKRDISLEFDVVLKPGQKGAIGALNVGFTGFKIMSGMYFEVQSLNKCIMGSEEVPINPMVSDQYSWLDLFKGFIHLIQGKIETDLLTKTVTVYPTIEADLYGDIVPPFVLYEEPSVDIQDQIIEESVIITPLRPDLKRYTRLQFAPATGADIDSLNLTEPAHSRKIINGMDLPDDVEELQNPVFEPTLEGVTSKIATQAGGRGPLPILPRLWDNTEGERSFNIAPRILFAFGLSRQKWPTPSPTTGAVQYTGFFWNTPPNPANTGYIQTWGYATQLRTIELDPAPDMDGNVVFGTAQNDLFVKFYLGLTQINQNASVINLLMYLRMRGYNNENFRLLNTFTIKGRRYQTPKTDILDFIPCEDIPTPVKFLALGPSTEPCNLPCGCRFKTCDYYQDFGIYMRQATLDMLQITSFMVDGVELVTSPVGFGDINIVDVGVNKFVTNLVDALNTFGAPYFTFGMSQRIDPERGTRFFWIKRPACKSFKIEISSGEAIVYLYTQDVQQTAWFTGGAFEDFGYAASTYGEPIDCVITTEY